MRRPELMKMDLVTGLNYDQMDDETKDRMVQGAK